MENLPIQIRPISQVDVPFVIASWLKSYKGAFFAKDIHPKTYFAGQHRVVSSLLQTCTTWVACAESDPTEIYGFICGEYQGQAFVLHYIYVKHTFRNLGIAKQLLAQFPLTLPVNFYTHHNAVAHKQAAAYHMLYNPYIALLPEYRKNKTSNNLNLNEKVKESENDEFEFKQHQARGSTPGSRRAQGSSGEGSAAD